MNITNAGTTLQNKNYKQLTRHRTTASGRQRLFHCAICEWLSRLMSSSESLCALSIRSVAACSSTCPPRHATGPPPSSCTTCRKAKKTCNLEVPCARCIRVHRLAAGTLCRYDHAGARALEERGLFYDCADSESVASSANFGEPDSPAFLEKMENSRIQRIFGDTVKVVIPQVAEHSHKVEARREVEQRQNELW
jgi:hypothetical protein